MPKVLEYDATIHGYRRGDQVEVKANDQRAKDAVAGRYAHWVEDPHGAADTDPEPASGTEPPAEAKPQRGRSGT